MKKTFLIILAVIIFIPLLSAQSTKNITIKGKVQFPFNRFKLEIYERDGFNKIIVDSFALASDSTYSYIMQVLKPGKYTLDCQKWQSVDFWAEDENLEINFRGCDTARIKIKNPPYVHIYGGPKNDVLNLLSFNNYRNYQQMIAAGKQINEASKSDNQTWKDYASGLYGQLNDDMMERVRYIVQYYGNQNSILAVLPMLRSEKDAELVAQTLIAFEKRNPNYAPLIAYKRNIAEAKAQKERLAIGKQAPAFKYTTPDGKKLGPQDFKGKYLLLDFWASWCGPCRKAIPHLKEIYEKYKNKGVEVLSVSIDKDEDAWRKAMDEEKMPWAQVQAPEAGKQAMTDYQFSGIPYIVLLDKNGNLMAKQLYGEMIEKTLDELFSK